MPAFPCPCCGYMVFDEPPGSYEICPVCAWEDDALQLEFATTLAGGANTPTLLDAQRSFDTMGVSDPALRSLVRARRELARDPLWRPIDLGSDSFERWDAPERERVPEVDERLYYWRPSFWRRPLA